MSERIIEETDPDFPVQCPHCGLRCTESHPEHCCKKTESQVEDVLNGFALFALFVLIMVLVLWVRLRW